MSNSDWERGMYVIRHIRGDYLRRGRGLDCYFDSSLDYAERFGTHEEAEAVRVTLPGMFTVESAPPVAGLAAGDLPEQSGGSPAFAEKT